MNDKKLRQLERHTEAAADILAASVLEAAPDALADHANGIDITARALDILAATTDAATLYRIAGDARTARKGA